MPERPLDIAVAAGKGGSGKTTVALHLAWAAVRAGRRVALCDCDAEAPNIPCFLSLDAPPTPVCEARPRIDHEHCLACGACVRACAFQACYLVEGQVRIASDLCHGCGVCARVCPVAGVITEVPIAIGDLRQAPATLPDGQTLSCVVARSIVGSTRTPAVIAAACAARPTAVDWCIRDCAPGTACPAVAGLRGADAALLVTEATPFGLHDLRLSVELGRALGLPLAVVVNRCGDYRAVQDWCASAGLPVVAELPDDPRVTAAAAGGHLAGAMIADFLARFDALVSALDTLCASQAAGATP